jgi:hypothetical protein
MERNRLQLSAKLSADRELGETPEVSTSTPLKLWQNLLTDSCPCWIV